MVLNADDQAAAGHRRAGRGCAGNAPVIRFFSAAPAQRGLERHKRAGGICYEVCDGQLIETDGGRQRVIMDVAELPGAFGGRARTWSRTRWPPSPPAAPPASPSRTSRPRSATFTPGEANPGRGNLYAVRRPDGPPARSWSTTATTPPRCAPPASWSRDVWGGEPVAAITLPGDRRDDLVAESAEAIAAWFGRVVIYEDDDLRGRSPARCAELIAAAMRRARPGITLVSTPTAPQAALRTRGRRSPPGARSCSSTRS